MMERKCFVTTCSNTYERTKNLCVIDEKSCTLTVITYHSFPRHPHLRRRWIEATGRTNWEPTNQCFICSEHFRESDYETLNLILPENDDNPTQLKRVLKTDAIPSVQLGQRVKFEKLKTHSSENNFCITSNTGKSPITPTKRKENHSCSHNNIDTSIVKNEPCSSEEFVSPQNSLPFIITSAITVKEENDHGDRPNGFIESSIEITSKNHLESKCSYGQDFIGPKRQKHQDSLIAPEDIKIERSSSPFDFNLNHTCSIEEKYERLLDEFLKLKRDYDLLKFKFERQSDAISKCEHILSECR